MTVALKTIEIQETSTNNVVNLKLTGRLTSEDYERFVPEIDELIEKHGKIRIVAELVDFHGWNAGALWEDTKFALKHFSDIERVAFVGDKQWEKGMAYFCKPFTRASIQYFDASQAEEARKWISLS